MASRFVGGGFAALVLAVCASAGAADGERLVKSKCTTCHTEKKVLDGVRKIDADMRQAHFDKFLVSHFAPDDAQRQAILGYLLAATK